MPDIAPQAPKVPVAGAGEAREMSRRRALAKLGLAATAAYAAPSVLHLDRSYASGSCSGGTHLDSKTGTCV